MKKYISKLYHIWKFNLKGCRVYGLEKQDGGLPRQRPKLSSQIPQIRRDFP